MGSIEWATWCLVIVTGGLVFATVFYVYYTKKLFLASKEQTFALDGLTIAIQEIPNIFTKAQLLSAVLNKYSSQESYETLSFIGDYGMKSSSKEAVKENFLQAGSHPVFKELDSKRRYLSAFFWEIKTFFDGQLLEENLLASALGKAPFDLFLKVVDPLTRAKAEMVNEYYDESICQFYDTFLKKHWGEQGSLRNIVIKK
jgi:hypothetical protein